MAALSAVFGLGNPGPEYRNSRHNVGFRVVEALAHRWGRERWQHRYASLVAIGDEPPVSLVKPLTYMNRSGDAVARFCIAETAAPTSCLVVVDDVDLPLGRLRLRARGSSGSHNGLRSIVDRVGEEFPRLRLGVRGESTWEDLADYVLEPFAPDEGDAVAAMVDRAADCVEATIAVGIAAAASRFNAPVE